MNNPVKDFGDTARGLARNPLGIIALFIVLVYGFACLVVSFGSSLTATERTPIIYFLVIFPVIVLAVFGWLVSKHAVKLYSPRDYRNEENYLAVVASLAAASVRRPTADSVDVQVDVKGIAAAVSRVSEAPEESKSDVWRQRLLWVDDRPENNVYERQAFEALGISVVLALSTAQALSYLERDKVAAIISDMGRREGLREGYVLLEAVRKVDKETPFFIYAGSNLPEHRREALERGAQGSTNNPQELFEKVTGVLKRSRVW